MDKKVLILNAALGLFVNQDIDRTSTASIAKKAGVSNGTLFHYFPTKNDLVIELYLLLKTEMFESIYSPEVIKLTDLKEKIRKGWMNAVNWICSNPHKHSYIHMVYKSNYKHQIHDDRLPVFYKEYVNMINESIKNKQLNTIPVELILEFINSYAALTAEYLIELNVINNQILKNKVFEMLWKSIQKEI